MLMLLVWPGEDEVWIFEARGTSASPTTDFVLLVPGEPHTASLFGPSYRPFLSPLGCGSGIPTSFEILLCPVGHPSPPPRFLSGLRFACKMLLDP